MNERARQALARFREIEELLTQPEVLSNVEKLRELGKERSDIEELARAPLESRLVALHTAKRDGQTLGYALIDVHTVRTLPEALMVVLSPEGKVQSVRVLAFHEPTDYQPPDRWYAQFAGRTLSPDLQLKRGIDGISGATLSARAATRTVRRALAYHRVLGQDPSVAGSE